MQIEKPLQKHGGRLEHNETYCGSCFGAEQVYLRVYMLNTDITHSEYNVYLFILSFDAIRQYLVLNSVFDAFLEIRTIIFHGFHRKWTVLNFFSRNSSCENYTQALLLSVYV